jgi:hypothetical protein
MWHHRHYVVVQSRNTCAWKADDLSQGQPPGDLSADVGQTWPFWLELHPKNTNENQWYVIRYVKYMY